MLQILFIWNNIFVFSQIAIQYREIVKETKYMTKLRDPA